MNQLLKQKYLALLEEAGQRKISNIEKIALCFLTLSLASSIDDDCAELLAPYNLSEGRFIVLFLLGNLQEGVSPHFLSKKAGVTRATITSLLDGLEHDGFVERAAHPNDRRSLSIFLTKQGKKLLDEVFERHTIWISGLFSCLTPNESRVLTKLLKKVAFNLHERKKNE